MNTYIYTQSTGIITYSNKTVISMGYAGGACGMHPENVNDHLSQAMHGVGPLPCGLYSMGVVADHPKLGAYAIPLIPDKNNQMFGRGGFFIHGDNSKLNHSASEGCIILPHNVRTAIYALGNTITVVSC